MQNRPPFSIGGALQSPDTQQEAQREPLSHDNLPMRWYWLFHSGPTGLLRPFRAMYRHRQQLMKSSVSRASRRSGRRSGRWRLRRRLMSTLAGRCGVTGCRIDEQGLGYLLQLPACTVLRGDYVVQGLRACARCASSRALMSYSLMRRPMLCASVPVRSISNIRTSWSVA